MKFHLMKLLCRTSLKEIVMILLKFFQVKENKNIIFVLSRVFLHLFDDKIVYYSIFWFTVHFDKSMKVKLYKLQKF